MCVCVCVVMVVVVVEVGDVCFLDGGGGGMCARFRFAFRISHLLCFDFFFSL